MSSTARGRARENLDFYPTPAWAVDLVLDRLGPVVGNVLEPAAGDGAIVKRLLARGYVPEQIDACEIDPGRADIVKGLAASVVCADFTSDNATRLRSYSLIITNPPFALAESFARRMIAMTLGRGTAALLLRLNWLGSQERAGFHRAHPADIFLLPKRPEFTASMSCSAKKAGCAYKETLPIEATRPRTCPLCGARTSCSTTDSIEYAWFVWGPGHGGRWEILPMPDA